MSQELLQLFQRYRAGFGRSTGKRADDGSLKAPSKRASSKGFVARSSRRAKGAVRQVFRIIGNGILEPKIPASISSIHETETSVQRTT
jgi:hypothetical protein